jgi:hypothetical protein
LVNEPLVIGADSFVGAEIVLLQLLSSPLNVSITFEMFAEYADDSFTLNFTPSGMSMLSILRASVDIDVYRIHYSRSDETDEPDYHAPRYSAGVRGASPRIHQTGVPVVEVGSDTVVMEGAVGGTMGRHLALVERSLRPIERPLRAVAVLRPITLWCRANGGWGRPAAIMSARQVVSLARTGATIELQASYI